MAAARDYYTVLGIPQSATAAEIKRAYRRAALKSHPDVNSSPNAQAIFVEICHAYETLSDEREREKYDRKLRREPFWGSSGTRPGRSSTSASSRYTSGRGSSSSSTGRSSGAGTRDPAGQEAARQWREDNPTRADIDDSFSKIFGDILGGIAGGVVGGRGAFEDLLTYLEDQMDGVSGESSVEFEELLASDNLSELQAELDAVVTLIKQLKRRLIDVGEQRQMVEAELARLASTRGSAPRDITDLDAGLELVEKAAGMKAKYDGIKGHVKKAQTREKRLEKRVQQLLYRPGGTGGSGASSSSGSRPGYNPPPRQSPRPSSTSSSTSRHSSTPPHRAASKRTPINPRVENELDKMKKDLGL
ncbi:unnamed protein product [Chrysoparadoxa australica]